MQPEKFEKTEKDMEKGIFSMSFSPLRGCEHGDCSLRRAGEFFSPFSSLSSMIKFLLRNIS